MKVSANQYDYLNDDEDDMPPKNFQKTVKKRKNPNNEYRKQDNKKLNKPKKINKREIKDL